MRQYRHYFSKKLDDAEFCDLFEKECHVCACTVKIFEKMTTQNNCVEDLAEAVQSEPAEVRALMDADYCNPKLVVRLCRHLDVPLPSACPRMEYAPNRS